MARQSKSSNVTDTGYYDISATDGIPVATVVDGQAVEANAPTVKQLSNTDITAILRGKK